MQIATYTYISLPILIFLTGWIKFYIAIPLCILIIISFYRAIKYSTFQLTPQDALDFRIKNNLWKYIAAFGIICFWVLISGIGKFAFQNGDHTTRNSLFELLVNNRWPVIVDSPYYDKPVGLIYYIGFWLPPALIGKCFGITAGYFAQAVWASIGIFLFYYIIIATFVKKTALWPLAVIIFFSGLDILGKYLMGEDIVSLFINNREHIEWWIGFPYLQYSSMTSQLFWVFNQAAPIWLCTVVIIAQKKSRVIVWLLALAMLYGVLPAIGIAVLVLAIIGKNTISSLGKKSFTATLRAIIVEYITFENYVGFVTALVFVMYFTGNLVNQSGSFWSWISFGGILVTVIVFFAVEAGAYLAVIAPFHKKNYLFYYVITMLLFICPWYVLGVYNDFCMRVSIPALVILMCLVIDTLSKSEELKMRKLMAAIICLLVIGGITPLNEIVRSISYTIEAEKSNTSQGIYSLDPIEVDSLRDQYYGYSDNVFFRYLAK
jgi:hypothetical protein